MMTYNREEFDKSDIMAIPYGFVVDCKTGDINLSFSSEAGDFVKQTIQCDYYDTDFDKKIILYFSELAEKYDYQSELYVCKVFESTSEQTVDPHNILISSSLSFGCEFESLLESDIFFSFDFPAALTVVDNRIVSAAWVNPSCDDNFADIAVETAEEFRHNGFGLSNVSLLTEHLLRNRKKITYISENDNFFSEKIAEKCGFVFAKIEKRVVWFKQ